MPQQFFISTLGCRLNQAESQDLQSRLIASGWQAVKNPRKASLMVVNTCVVTAKAEKETRQTISHLRKVNPKAKLVAAGCWVDKIRLFDGKVSGEVDEMLGNEGKWERLMENGKLRMENGEKIKPFMVRRLIKIQTGCGNVCTYCLARLVRGKPKSMPAAKIISQVKKALKNGALEIVLTGMNISQYDDRGKSWIDLVKEVLLKTPVKLLRLGSINPKLVETGGEPEKWAGKLVSIYKGIGRNRLARHLHLSLQSGSNRILKLMGRNYSTADYERVVKSLRRIRGMNITTDIIVGFPGETEKDFRQTIGFLKKIGFGQIHIFRYSSRPGTISTREENMRSGANERVKKKKALRLAQVAKGLHQEFTDNELGKSAIAMIWADGQGLTDNYLPIKVEKCSRNKVKKVFLTSEILT